MDNQNTWWFYSSKRNDGVLILVLMDNQNTEQEAEAERAIAS